MAQDQASNALRPPVGATSRTSPLQYVTQLSVRYAERYIPDPFLYAVILTFVVAAGAFIWTPSSPVKIITSWYGGIWTILTFAMQMALVLATGVTLADAPIIKRLLAKLAGLATTQTTAAVIVFLAAAIGSWLNWGFGLVVGALIAREIAKRLREVDFGFLVAAAYMGFMTWCSGLSSSIALITATHGNALNFVEKFTGQTAGLDQTIFTAYNLVPLVLLVILIPFCLRFMAPAPKDMKKVDPQRLRESETPPAPEAAERTFASVINNSWLVTVLLVAMGVFYEWPTITTTGFSLDVNAFIFNAATLGLLLHWRPVHYVHSFMASAKTVGGILLQFPLYGGIMGIITATGLATLLAEGFVAFSTAGTLPFWSYICSNIITFFVPSGGGHWAVQGPFMLPAAVKLGAHPAMVAQAIALGEQTANMLQPFWALPILAIAGLGIKDIMGYCMIAFVVGVCLFGGSLLIFA